MFSVHLERNYKLIKHDIRLYKLFQWVTLMALLLLLHWSLECLVPLWKSCEETLVPTCSSEPRCTETPFNKVEASCSCCGRVTLSHFSACKVQCRKQGMCSTEILVQVAVNMQRPIPRNREGEKLLSCLFLRTWIVWKIFEKRAILQIQISFPYIFLISSGCW